LDFLTGGLRKGTNTWMLTTTPPDETSSPADRLLMTESPNAIVVETGCAEFHLDRRRLQPFTKVRVGGEDVLKPDAGGVIFTAANGRGETARIEQLAVEARGPVRATVRLEGHFTGRDKLRFVARMSFYAGAALVRFALTIHNPRRARHQGGIWDLGDSGSVLFRDLSLELQIRSTAEPTVTWTAEAGQLPTSTGTGALELYQDSSGGDNWQSRNHVNRDGRIPVSFRGYRVRQGDEKGQGLRASPVARLQGTDGGVTVAVAEFWQQFPKALEVEGATLYVRLFPKQFSDLFELQGGEQKTHVVWLDFTPTADQSLSWVHQPVRVNPSLEWYAASGTVPYLSPRNENTDSPLWKLLAGALEGANSLVARREIIDEYGWRNFGDMYADHEAAYYKGPAPIISHYNNQYDVVYGTLLNYFRTGDRRWYRLCDELARHVIDIDLYHTDQDRAAYNGGLFWHTDHYRDAATSSHRSYSRANQKPGQPYGGGPCNEHNWTTGLLHYYYHTGDLAARDAVLGMADWVIALDDGSRTVFRLVDDGPTGQASCTTERDFHGPGRGCGNSVNTLLNGWLLSGNRRYLAKAEELIRRTIHPRDDIAARDLLNAEQRWSYTVYLSVLARYLDLKAEAGEVDHAYAYAQASLLHYAVWMLEHEVPYFDRPEQLDYPTETWAAQELRKANVLRLAAAHAVDPLQAQLLQCGAELADRAWADLLRFERPDTTRALAIVFTEGLKDASFREGQLDDLPAVKGNHEFGAPESFVAQRRRVLTRLKSASGLAALFLRLANPHRWLKLFWPR
jgi:hypothetical protein